MTAGMTAGMALVAALGAAVVAAAPAVAAGTAAAQAPVQTPRQTSGPQGGETDAARLAKAYAECMSLARSDPDRALARAHAWEQAGGGDGARHCAAVATLTLGHYEEAAQRLEDLAETVKEHGAVLKGELYAQAGQAWLIGGHAEKALAAQTRAIDIEGRKPELLIDRAITYASLGKYWDAIDDLNGVIDQAPTRADALIFRATAWRKLAHLDLAMDDIRRAIAIAPHQVDALLERGIIRHLRGDEAGARADWRKVLDIDPKSPAATAARENLGLPNGDGRTGGRAPGR